jgi:hypothetical protein
MLHKFMISRWHPCCISLNKLPRNRTVQDTTRSASRDGLCTVSIRPSTDPTKWENSVFQRTFVPACVETLLTNPILKTAMRNSHVDYHPPSGSTQGTDSWPKALNVGTYVHVTKWLTTGCVLVTFPAVVPAFREGFATIMLKKMELLALYIYIA